MIITIVSTFLSLFLLSNVFLYFTTDNCLDKLFAEESNIFIDKVLLWSQSSEEYVRNSCPVAIGNVARTGL